MSVPRFFGPVAAVWILPLFAAEPMDFSRDIEPLLRKRCHACHGSVTQMSGLRLDLKEAALKGGDSGAVILPGKSAESRLIRLVAGLEDKKVMPPAGPRLTPAEVGLLRAWVDQGAKWPDAPQTAAGAAGGKARPSHWAFQPVSRPQPPSVRSAAWARNPIDRFVLARLEREGIEPSAEADRRTLIRRVSFDLTGLPPTPAEVDAFLRDNRPDAYERLVDRLLESQHYGERWARHWLDLARYADSDGYEKDYYRPNAWRWRHWVIESFNQDKPFDQFTIEQIAGDLLPGAGLEQRIATGFHRNTLTNREGGVNIEQFRVEQVVDRAATVGTVWLGLTMGCAQCHDHKYDPIRQKEFYQLYSFFNNAVEDNVDAPLAGEMGPFLQTTPAYRKQREELLKQYRVLELQAPWEAKMREARANPGKWTDWDHAYDALQKYLDHSDRILDVPIEQRSQKWADSMVDHFVINYHRVIPKEEWKQLKFVELRKKLNDLRDQYPALSEAPVIAEHPSIRRASHIHLRGDWRRKGAEVHPGTPAFLPPLTANPATRIDLAKWLVARENPLTARVTVNRFWQEFFGSGLVRTPDNFGTQGEKPSHPELLDWLAASFMDNGWHMKALHKLMVTSATYRQSSAARPDIDARDPGNMLLARQVRLRLPAELIRDAALSVSDLLYPAVGGKSVRPPIPQGVVELSYGGSVKWPESTGRDRYRRGLYVLFQRTVPYPMLMNFDEPDASLASCRRERSNTPLQALNLLNDPVFVEAAQALAARALRTPAAHRTAQLFETCLARTPSPREREWVDTYLRKQIQLLEENPKQAEEMFPLQFPGHSPVEAGAWTALASALLNLDEFITRE
ncbi:MAG TPA: PSD1 and planctomycete cytochrome C domain-containing protein [Bryobacteraceae bacterium]|nr:PSD1 and planctomycete cytochrome C domain-containing protein [Bryobacteraceae bacterium]